MPQKKDPNSNPTRNALSLFSLLLYSGRSYSLKYLAELYTCSKQTVIRLIEQIALSQNTNLAVVAPGIAEALMATAVGLVAAIPAVVFYNKLNADSEHIQGGYESFADEFATILSRQLDS